MKIKIECPKCKHQVVKFLDVISQISDYNLISEIRRRKLLIQKPNSHELFEKIKKIEGLR